jgi:hypothetical protein
MLLCMEMLDDIHQGQTEIWSCGVGSFVFIHKDKSMSNKTVLSSERKNEILETFCWRSHSTDRCLVVLHYGEPQNRKKLSGKIQKDSEHIYFVALLESGNITLKATNGSGRNLKELFKDKEKLLGVVYL